MKKILLFTLLLGSSVLVRAQWSTNGTNIYYNAGNIGMGTTAPAAPVHISSIMTPGAVNEVLRLEQRGNGGNELGGEGAAISFYTPMTPSPDLLGAKIYSYRENGINNSPTTALRFSTNNAGTVYDRLTISGTGNVGIGTTDDANWNLANSAYKLAVEGSFIATSVTVKNRASWPDFVFKKRYVLLPLRELNKYIDIHQHLPEIPSAALIAKNGQDLGEMNRLLLKKVEELTLYLIEKDNQFAVLEKRVRKLEKKKSK